MRIEVYVLNDPEPKIIEVETVDELMKYIHETGLNRLSCIANLSSPLKCAKKEEKNNE